MGTERVAFCKGVFALLFQLTFASHFRGGTVSWISDANQTTNATISGVFSFRFSWRYDYGWGSGLSACSNAGECHGWFGQADSLSCVGCRSINGNLEVSCTDCSPPSVEDWATGQSSITATIDTNSIVTAIYHNNAWIDPWNDWSVFFMANTSVRHDTGQVNNPPSTVMDPIWRVSLQCNTSAKIPSIDADGDSVRCRWAQNPNTFNKDECDSICRGIHGIDWSQLELAEDTCILTWKSNGQAGSMRDGDFYYIPVAVQLEDFEEGSEIPLSSIPLQFLVQVKNNKEANCSQSGISFVHPTRHDDSCVAVQFGSVLNESAYIQLGGPFLTVDSVTTQTSAEIARSLRQTGQQTWQFDYTWVPTPDMGISSFFFQFQAVDNIGEETNVVHLTLLSGVSPPAVTSFAPSGVVLPSTSSWSITFDQNVQRPFFDSMLTFVKVSNNEVVAVVNVATDYVNVHYSANGFTANIPAFVAEKEQYYVQLDSGAGVGYGYCGPESLAIRSSSVWSITGRDITPPKINCSTCPTVCNGTATFEWSFDEAVQDPVKCVLLYLDKSSSQTDLSCTSGGVTVTNMKQGTSTLQVTASDLSNNTASYLFSVYSDLQMPNATFVKQPTVYHNSGSVTFEVGCADDYATTCTYMSSLESSTTNSSEPCTSNVQYTGLTGTQWYTLRVVAFDEVSNPSAPLSTRFFVDLTKPVLSLVSNATVACTADQTPHALGTPTATDDSGLPVTITYVDHFQACITTRQWSATDAAGNIASVNQYITVTDVEAPLVQGSPILHIPCANVADMLIYLNDWTNSIEIIQSCNRSLMVTHNDMPNPEGCGLTFQRQWIVTTDCGTTAQYNQQIVVLPQDVPLYPSNKQSNVELSPEFVWRSYDQAVEYYVFLWAEGVDVPASPQFITTNTFVEVAANATLRSAALYNWQVLYVTPSDTYPSPIWSFTTKSFCDFAVISVRAPSSVLTGVPFTVQYTVTNLGPDSNTDTSWTDLIEASIGLHSGLYVAFATVTGIYSAGQSYSNSFSLTIPRNLPGVYFAVIVAPFSVISNEVDAGTCGSHYATCNNWHNSNPINAVPPPTANLVFSSADVLTVLPQAGQNILLQFEVENIGGGATVEESWTDCVYINVSSQITGFISSKHYGNIGPGQSYTVQQTVLIDQHDFGNITFIFSTDCNNDVFEYNEEGDNTIAHQYNIAMPLVPDLTVSHIQVPENVVAGKSFNVTYTIDNVGDRDLQQNVDSWNDRVSLMQGNTERSLLAFSTQTKQVATGDSYITNVTLLLPIQMTTGRYNLSVFTNYLFDVYELKYINNNELSIPIAVTQYLPNYAVEFTKNQELQVQLLPNGVHTIQGNITVTQTVSDAVIPTGSVLSISCVLVLPASQISYVLFKLPTAAILTSSTTPFNVTTNVFGPVLFPVKVVLSGVLESDYTDNEAQTAVTIPQAAPILKISGVDLDSNFTNDGATVLFAGSSSTVKVTITNVGNADFLGNLVFAVSFSTQNQEQIFSMRSFEFIGMHNDTSPVLSFKLPTNAPLGPNHLQVQFTQAETATTIYESLPIYVKPVGKPKLNLASLTAYLDKTNQQLLHVTWTVQNFGNSMATVLQWHDQILLNQTVVADYVVARQFLSGDEYTVNLIVNLPSNPPPMLQLQLIVDSFSNITDQPIDGYTTVDLPPTKTTVLYISQIATSIDNQWGGNFTGTFTIHNIQGSLEAIVLQFNIYILNSAQVSRDIVVQFGFLVSNVLTKVDSLCCDQNQLVNFAARIPRNYLGDVHIYIVPVVDSSDQLTWLNNIFHFDAHVLINEPPSADLSVRITAVTPQTVQPGSQIQVSYTITNKGVKPVVGLYTDVVYIVAQGAYISIGSINDGSSLKVNESTVISSNLSVPLALQGGYYQLLVWVDRSGVIIDSDLSNNQDSTVIRYDVASYQVPDLSITNSTVVVTNNELQWSSILQCSGATIWTATICVSSQLQNHNTLQTTSLGMPTCVYKSVQDCRHDISLAAPLGAVPLLMDGAYNLITSFETVPRDTNTTNNKWVIANALTVQVPLLEFGQTYQFNVVDNLLLRVDQPATSTTGFTVSYNQTGGNYVATSVQLARVPSESDNIALTFTDNAHVVTPVSYIGSGSYYVLLKSVAATSWSVTIAVIPSTLQVLSVQPMVVTQADSVTLTVTGSMLQPGTKVALIWFPIEVESFQVRVISPTMMYSSFNTTNVPTGTYDFRLKDPTTNVSATLNAAVSIQNLPQGKLQLSIDGASNVVSGKSAALTFTATNIGYSDLQSVNTLFGSSSSTPSLQGACEQPQAVVAPVIGAMSASSSFSFLSFLLEIVGIPQVSYVFTSAPKTVEMDIDSLKTAFQNALPGITTQQWNLIWNAFTQRYSNDRSTVNAWANQIVQQLADNKQTGKESSDGLLLMLNVAQGLPLNTYSFTQSDIDMHDITILNVVRTFGMDILSTTTQGAFGIGWCNQMLDSTFWKLDSTDAYFKICSQVVNVPRDAVCNGNEACVTVPETVCNGAYSANAIDNRIVLQNPDSSNYTFDVSTGRLLRISYSDNFYIDLQYGSNSVVATDNSGAKLSFEMSPSTLVNSATLTSPDGQTLASSTYQFSQNQLVFATNVFTGGVVGYSYDDFNKLRQVDHPGQYAWSYSYDSNGALAQGSKYTGDGNLISQATYNLDNTGRITTASNVGNLVIVSTYDEENNVVSRQTLNELSQWPSVYVQTIDGDQRTVEVYMGSQRDVPVRRTSLNQATEQNIDTDALGRTVTTTDNGNSRTITDKIGCVYQMIFNDNREQLLSVLYPDKLNVIQQYSEETRMVASITQRDGTIINQQYDTLGRLTDRTGPSDHFHTEFYTGANSDTPASYSSRTDTVSFNYDLNNRISLLSHQDSYAVAYEWTSDGQLASVAIPNLNYSVSYYYDQHNRFFKAVDEEDGSTVVLVTYNESSNLPVKYSYSNGASTVFTYFDNSTTIQSVASFDKTNRILTSSVHKYENGYRSQTTTLTGTTFYHYDNTGSLVGWSDLNSKQTTLTYDANNNRIRVQASPNNQDIAIQTNCMNQAVSVAGKQQQYDDNGNLLERVWSDGATSSMEYDEFRRMLSAGNATQSCRYTYDALGSPQQSVCSPNDLTTTYYVAPFLFYGSTILAEQLSTGELRKYYHVPLVGLTKMKRTGGRSGLHFIQDGDSSIIRILDDATNVVNSYEYNPFGETTASKEKVDGIEYRYRGAIGARSLSVFGGRVIKMRKRLYDPELGKFLSLDPADNFPNTGLNRYDYCYAAPFDCADPSGEIPLWARGVGAIGELLCPECELAAVGIGAAIGAMEAVAGDKVIGKLMDGKMSWGELADDVVSGAASGAGGVLEATNPVLGFGVAVAGGIAGDVLKDKIDGGPPTSWLDRIEDGLSNGIGLKGEGKSATKDLEQAWKHLKNSWKKQFTWKNLKKRAKELLKKEEEKAKEALKDCFEHPIDCYNKIINWLHSIDPNEMVGPTGYGSGHFISSTSTLSYRIRFENEANATAPARKVYIEHEVPDNCNILSARFVGFGFGQQDIQFASPIANANTMAAVQSLPNQSVVFSAQPNIQANKLVWLLQTVYANSSIPADGVGDGFLPPNINGSGMGYVDFQIKLSVSKLSEQIPVTASATITFDNNPQLSTNVYTNFVDLYPPTSVLTALYVNGTTRPFIQVQGNDSASGVSLIDVYVKSENNSWTYVVQAQSGDTVSIPSDVFGLNVAFASRAVDNVGNIEQFPTTVLYLDIPQQMYDCPNACSQHGSCTTNGQCNCDSGFYGSMCEMTGQPIEPPIIEFWGRQSNQSLNVLLFIDASNENDNEGALLSAMIQGLPVGSTVNGTRINSSNASLSLPPWGSWEVELPASMLLINKSIDLQLVLMYQALKFPVTARTEIILTVTSTSTTSTLPATSVSNPATRQTAMTPMSAPTPTPIKVHTTNKITEPTKHPQHGGALAMKASQGFSFGLMMLCLNGYFRV